MHETNIRVGNKCNKCDKDAKIVLPYGPHRFCAEHFNYFFEQRVKKTTRMSAMIKYGEKIAVALSGGKDSMVTLHLLNEMFGKTNLNKIEAIMIDEGIKGYREKAIEIALKYCKEKKIPYHIVNYSEKLGLEMNEVAQKIHSNPELGSACSFCGVFRRDLLNEKALEIKAGKLATGHNLDDEVQSIAMSFFGNDLSKVIRSGEVAGNKKIEGFVQRIKPLYETPEKEIIAYAALNGIEHYSYECCPYSWMAKRNTYRKLLNELENEIPGTKHSILASFKNLKPILVKSKQEKNWQIMQCAKCGKPSNANLCSACKQLERIRQARVKEIEPIEGSSGAQGCAITKGSRVNAEYMK